MGQIMTNPAGFRTPHTLRSRVFRSFWLTTQSMLFRYSPWFMNGWRTAILRLFGAKIAYAGIHGSVKVWAPWRLVLGSQVYIAEGVNLYNTYGITIGDRVVISQDTFLCTATHDYTVPEYPLTGAAITIMNDCWIAAGAFIGPGVTIGEGAVVGAKAVVVKDVEAWTVVAGNPARFIKKRVLQS